MPQLSEEDQLQFDIDGLFWTTTNWGGAPHSYIVGKNEWCKSVVERIVQKIALEGKDETWYKTKVRYYYLNNFRYWGDLTLINRVEIGSPAVLKEQAYALKRKERGEV